MSEQSHSENSDIQWALDLLKPDPTYEPSVLQKYASEGIFMGGGFVTACLKNVYNQRPSLAGKCIYWYTTLLLQIGCFFKCILQHNLISTYVILQLILNNSCLLLYFIYIKFNDKKTLIAINDYCYNWSYTINLNLIPCLRSYFDFGYSKQYLIIDDIVLLVF